MDIQQQLLQDRALDNALLDKGFVVIPFLTPAETDTLVDFYYQHHSLSQEGLYATAHVADVDFRMKMNNFIKQIFARAIAQIFINHVPLGGSYIAKGKGAKGTLEPHQDWNIVDETKFRSFNIWVPLVDLNDDNGVIKILPESHAWLTTYRSANISSAFSTANKLLWKEMQSLYMKKGEALIYDHRLLHASGENKTNEIRLAAVYGIIPEGSEMRYYHKADTDKIEVFESNPEFFLYGNIFSGPNGLKSLDKFSFNFPEVNEQALNKYLKR
ncbi:phytanoyl-CoA dioxygenase family protein, partial [uncultured Mucilaginibacter sp.]|uniref:phytanoyl-CoA dioxygenase family protein n=1 Tax=uncultured Mucilaginibacter sp. TaxID=797541 RepID=UPI0025DEC622